MLAEVIAEPGLKFVACAGSPAAKIAKAAKNKLKAKKTAGHALFSWAAVEAKKGRRIPAAFSTRAGYRVDSISNPQASNRGSGMYFEFLLRRAHSRKRVERMYWSGVNLYSFTACSNDVTMGTTGPIGSGLPQLGLPRLFAIVGSSCLYFDGRVLVTLY